MKINVEVDLTPEELRRFMGLPDVAAVHKQLLEQFTQRVSSSAEQRDEFMRTLLSGCRHALAKFLQHGFRHGFAARRSTRSVAPANPTGGKQEPAMRLSAQDASFIYSETASGPMHGAALTIIEGEVPFDLIRRQIASRLHLVPRYRQRPGVGTVQSCPPQMGWTTRISMWTTICCATVCRRNQRSMTLFKPPLN